MHVMIDLETLSLRMDTAIMEVGYALFEPKVDGVIYHASQCLNVSQQINDKRSVDFSSIQWWMKQSDAARSSVFAEGQYPLLHDYLQWSLSSDIDWENVEGIWSHGAAFDLAILTHAYLTMGVKVPWNYRSVRDTRTLYDVVGMQLVDLIQAELKHSAESDAIAQALSVQKAYRLLREKNIT